ncbi:hypothetical protein CEP51_012756 [Fusarium floridanum]|uniref:C2H2-type domain-containing protein n=1 Tax=Fusarium floridanum TaxID=1325733 RepID=A0A428QNF9_9HYPO|nr:hypothetical protein CEP51_012756 [Fusarium floridanum]
MNNYNPSLGRGRGANTSSQAPQQTSILGSFAQSRPQAGVPSHWNWSNAPWSHLAFSGTSNDSQTHQQILSSSGFDFSGQNYRNKPISECETLPDSTYGSGLTQSNANISNYGEDPDPESNAEAQLVGRDFQSLQLQPQSAVDDSPFSSWNRPRPPASIATAPVKGERLLPCPNCSKQCRTRSELKKHMLKHTLPYHCDVRGCSREKGFTSRNDLDRHKRTVHADRSVAGRFFVCHLEGCAKKKHKLWPRADNFRCHLLRVHGKQYRADDDLTEYVYRSPPPSQDLQGVGGSAMDYMPSQSSHFTLPPSSEIVMPPTFRDPYGEESRRRASNEVLPRISTSISFDRDSSNLAPVQEGEGFCIAPGYLNGTASNTGISLSPTAWQPSNSSEQNLSGGSQSAFGSEPQGTATSMAMEDTSRDNQSDIGASGTLSSNTDDQEPEQPDVRMTDADDAPTATSTPRGQAAKDPSSQSRESVDAVLDKIPKHLIERYLKVKEGSVGSKDDASKQDTAVGKGQNQMHKCTDCPKTFSRQCELKKHLKRHSKPYGCTFPNCRKVFGSKNDWKRHESIQHYQLETWNCDHPKPNSTEVCGKVCHRRESFRNHLSKEHAISDSTTIEEKLDCCRKGRHCDVKFWCGFCVKIIEITEAENAWAKRCDHIDDHFCGRGQPLKHISMWEHEDPKDNEASPTREAEEDSPLQSSASNAGPRSPHSSTPTAEAKKSASTQYMWICCNCNEYHNYSSRTTGLCFNCDHNRCTGCKIGEADVNERLDLA